MLDLLGLSTRLLFPPGGEELYRQIALLTDMREGDEVLDVACGRGVSLEYFVREYGVHGSGVDSDPDLIQQAEDRARESGLSGDLQFQSGSSAALPYRDHIFDVAVGELGLAARCDPDEALRELVRVTKPGGSIVLIQLVWKAPVDEVRQRVLTEHLGTRPLMLVEWKRRLRDLGVFDLHTEDWSDEETAFRARVVKPFPDFAEIFSLWEKIGIIRRAWRRWGLRGVRTVLAREYEVHALLTRERVLGLDLLMGTTEGEPADAVAEDAPEPEKAEDPVGTARPVGEADPTEGGEETEEEGEVEEVEEVAAKVEATPDTAGLPLFERDDTNG